MCVNSHYIYNRYIRKSVLVDCGRCESCLQRKAAMRSNRIRNNVESGQICLFVTLTYKNEFVPYVRYVDAYNQLNVIPVYRDKSVRLKRCVGSYKQEFKVDDKQVLLDSYWLHDLWPTVSNNLLPQLTNKPGCVGVCYYKDLQDFFKRLRVNLQRHYNCYAKFTSFSCSEYGGHTFRPHFHSLIFIPREFETVFRSAIVESWPFADSRRTFEFVEVARDCASYVSSYVNGGSCLRSMLSLPCFRQKHSYSKVFGLGVDCFNLPSLLEKVKQGDLRYYSKCFTERGSSISSFPIPKYVVNRFFPQFKGFSRMSPDALRDVVLYPSRLRRFREELDYSFDDYRKILVRLNNAFSYYNEVTGKNRFDFAYDYCSIWTAYKSAVLKNSFLSVEKETDWLGFYENISDWNCDIVRAPSLVYLKERGYKFTVNPNHCNYRLEMERTLVPLYRKMCKQRYVTNEVMSLCGYDV